MSGYAIFGIIAIVFGVLFIATAVFSKWEPYQDNISLYVSGGIAVGSGIALVVLT